MPTYSSPMPTDLPPGWVDIGRSVVLELTGLDSDVAVLVDGSLRVLSAPAHWDSTVNVGPAEVVHDIDALHDYFDDGRATLLSVGPNGLTSTSYDPETDVWASEVIGAGSWTTATVVCTGQIDGLRKDDIASLQSGGTSVAWLYHANDGTYQPGGAFSLLEPAFCLLILDWNGDGARDLAACAHGGIYIYEPDGTLIDVITRSFSAQPFAVVNLSGQAAQYLAWVHNGRFAAIAGQNGFFEPVNLGGDQGAACLSTADGDRDGDDDLYIIRADPDTTLGSVLVYRNEPSGGHPSFVFDQECMFANSLEQTDITGPPLPADLDADGDVDLMVCSEGTEQRHVFFGTEVDANETRPELAPGSQHSYYANGHTGVGILNTWIAEPTYVTSQPDAHLRVRVWRKESLTGATSAVLLEDLEILEPLSSISWPYEVELHLNETGSSDAVFFLEARIVTLDGNGGVSEAWTPFTWAFTTTEGAHEELCLRPGNDALGILILWQFEPVRPEHDGGFSGGGTTGPTGPPPPPLQ